MIEIDRGLLRRVMAVDLSGLKEQDRLAMHQRDADAARDPGHPAAMRRGDEMLHLHRFQHRDLLAGPDQIALRDLDRHDGALQRRGHRERSLGRRLSDGGLCRSRLAHFDQGCGEILRRADQRRHMGIDEVGADLVPSKTLMRQDRAEERDVGGDAADPEFTQGARCFVHHVGPFWARRMHDDFCQQRVERGRGPVAGIAEGIDANAGAGRQVEHTERAAGRFCHSLLVHHLHVDAKLHRIAARQRYR
ncbi:hypothetical protein AB7M56_005480 [Bradyrhizobium elkanii]